VLDVESGECSLSWVSEGVEIDAYTENVPEDELKVHVDEFWTVRSANETGISEVEGAAVVYPEPEDRL